MKPTSSYQHSNVTILLQEGYLASDTIKNWSREVYHWENQEGGGWKQRKQQRGTSFQTVSIDKRSIICHIASGRLDKLWRPPISSTTSFPVLSQPKQSGIHSRKMAFALLSRRNVLFSKRPTDWSASNLPGTMKIGQWRIGRILWSDETKINRIGSDGRAYYLEEEGEPLCERTTTPTVKHGGGNNLMVWGCMGWNGVGVLTEVQGIMNAEHTGDILDEGVVESFEKLEMLEGERMFQQDNDPKHTSKKATKWFKDNSIDVMVWPAESPDINPIEHLWVDLKKTLNKYRNPAKGVHELWERVVEWNKIPPETCQKLIESMPRRITAVIKAKGWPYKVLVR